MRKFWTALKVSLSFMLLAILVVGIIFYVAYGEEILEMQAEAR